MPDIIKQAGIKQANGTYQMKDIGVDYENVDGLSTEATSFKAINDKNEKDITEYVAGISKDDENITITDGDGNTSNVDLSMVGATSSANGEAGFVPAPTSSDRTKYLKGDGTWAEPVNEDINVEVPWYGTCASTAASAAKVVSTTSGNFELSSGAKVVVKFTNGNTNDSALTLNVDNTGATAVKIFNNSANNLRDYKIVANDIIEFIYTGTYFVAMPSMSELSHMQDDRIWFATCSTSAASSSKFATTTVNGNNTVGFSLFTGAKVRVKFTYSNTALTPTLSVNSGSDIAIKAYGTNSPSLWWKAGDIVDFTYDGTNWIMSPSAGQISQLGEGVGFIGTRAEIDAAMQAGAIPDGMLVYCTDDLTGFPVNADDVVYDNTTSGLSADNVQDAVDEINTALSDTWHYVVGTSTSDTSWLRYKSIAGVCYLEGNIGAITITTDFSQFINDNTLPHPDGKAECSGVTGVGLIPLLVEITSLGGLKIAAQSLATDNYATFCIAYPIG